MKKVLLFFLVFALSLGIITGCAFENDYLNNEEPTPSQIILPTVDPEHNNGNVGQQPEPSSEEDIAAKMIPEDGEYYSKDDVALYIYQYGKLPSNYITKREAEELGWEGGSVEPYAPGKSIGGNRFGNYEGLLPEKKGRSYTECDIDTLGKSSRGAKRIVFSNDGLIYYTDDHYESFILLYGEDLL